MPTVPPSGSMLADSDMRELWEFMIPALAIGLLALATLLTVAQKTILAEFERRGMFADILPLVRKVLTCLGLALILFGTLWTLHTAGIIDLAVAQRYLLQVSLIALGLLLVYLYLPVQSRKP